MAVDDEILVTVFSDAEAMRQKVEAARAGEDPVDHLSDYEKDLKKQMAGNARDATPDCCDPDYMSLSSAPAFNDAASADASSAPVDKQVETDATQIKNTPRPAGQGAPKLG